MTGAEVIAVRGDCGALIKIRSDGQVSPDIMMSITSKEGLKRDPKEVLSQFLTIYCGELNDNTGLLDETVRQEVFEFIVPEGTVINFDSLSEIAEAALVKTGLYPGYRCGYTDYMIFINCDEGTWNSEDYE